MNICDEEDIEYYVSLLIAEASNIFMKNFNFDVLDEKNHKYIYCLSIYTIRYIIFFRSIEGKKAIQFGANSEGKYIYSEKLDSYITTSTQNLNNMNLAISRKLGFNAGDFPLESIAGYINEVHLEFLKDSDEISGVTERRKGQTHLNFVNKIGLDMAEEFDPTFLTNCQIYTSMCIEVFTTLE